MLHSPSVHPPREKRPLKPCPIPGCEATVQRGRLMCLSHWTGLPHKLRSAVNASWRDFRRADVGEPRLFHLRRYNAAADAAVSAATACEERVP